MLNLGHPTVGRLRRAQLYLLLAAALTAQAAPVAYSSGLFQSIDQNVNLLNTATLTPPPSVVVMNVQQTSLDVHWAASQSALVDGYQVYRAETLGGPYQAVSGVLDASTLSVTDSGLMPATNYFYVVRSRGAGWESANSMELHAATAP